MSEYKTTEAQRLASRKYRERHPDRIRKRKESIRKRCPDYWREAHERWRKNNPMDVILQGITTRSKASGIPCNITLDYLKSLPLPKKCPVLGIKMKFQAEDRNFTISLDRIVPSLGYVQGNVRWISYRANRLLCDGSLKEFKQIVKFLEENTDGTFEAHIQTQGWNDQTNRCLVLSVPVQRKDIFRFDKDG